MEIYMRQKQLSRSLSYAVIQDLAFTKRTKNLRSKVRQLYFYFRSLQLLSAVFCVELIATSITVSNYNPTLNSSFILYLDFDIKCHKILFEDRKVGDSEQQIKFTGIPFVVIGNQLLDCVHGKDHHKPQKTARAKSKKDNKVNKLTHEVS